MKTHKLAKRILSTVQKRLRPQVVVLCPEGFSMRSVAHKRFNQYKNDIHCIGVFDKRAKLEDIHDAIEQNNLINSDDRFS